MLKKLNRGKWIRKKIGEGLKEEGFVYTGFKGDVWVFEKQYQENVTWYVYIYVYRFDPWQITFHLATNVPAKLTVYAHQIVDAHSRKEDLLGYWRFHDEESLIKVLEEMVQIIRNEGKKVLEELSIPEKIYDTKEMHKELFEHHQEYAERFVEKTGIIATGYDEENIERWLDYIVPRIEKLREQDYEDVADEIIEMSAFVGEQIAKYCNGSWEIASKSRFCLVRYKLNKNPNLEMVIPILRRITAGYMGKGREWMRNVFLDVIE